MYFCEANKGTDITLHKIRNYIICILFNIYYIKKWVKLKVSYLSDIYVLFYHVRTIFCEEQFWWNW